MSEYKEDYVFKKHYILLAEKAVVLNDKNELLLLKRSEKSGKGGRWDLCGGAPEEREGPIEAIAREIKEESGLDVTEIQPIMVTSFNEEDFVVMIGYQARAVNTNVVLSWEHDEFIWKSIDEALQMDIPEFFKETISSLKL